MNIENWLAVFLIGLPTLWGVGVWVKCLVVMIQEREWASVLIWLWVTAFFALVLLRFIAWIGST